MKLFTGSALLITLLAFTSAASAQTSLKNFAKNEQFEMVSTIKTLMTQEIMGQTMEINIDMTSTQNITVKEKTDQATVFSISTQKLKASLNAMGQDQRYDSEDPSTHSGEMGEAMGKMLNKPVDVSVDNAGKKTVLTPVEADGGGGMISQLTGGKKEDGGLESFIFHKDLSSLKQGDSWMDSTTGNGKKTVSTYTVTEKNDKTITIGTLMNSSISNTIEQMGMEVAVNMSLKSTTTTVYDLASQRMTQSVSKVEGTGTAEAQGMSIPLTLTTDSNAVATKK